MSCIGTRRDWIKIRTAYWDSPSHAELSPYAYAIGPRLMALADVDDWRDEGRARLVSATGQPLDVRSIARKCNAYSPEEQQAVMCAIDELIAVGTMALDAEGYLGFPKYREHQENKGAVRTRKHRGATALRRQYVYFLEDEKGRCKIGMSANPWARRKDLERDHGPLTLLTKLPGGLDVEAEHHQRFASLHLTGEWFSYSGELRSYVAELRERYGSNYEEAEVEAEAEKKRVDPPPPAAESFSLAPPEPKHTTPLPPRRRPDWLERSEGLTPAQTTALVQGWVCRARRACGVKSSVGPVNKNSIEQVCKAIDEGHTLDDWWTVIERQRIDTSSQGPDRARQWLKLQTMSRLKLTFDRMLASDEIEVPPRDGAKAADDESAMWADSPFRCDADGCWWEAIDENSEKQVTDQRRAEWVDAQKPKRAGAQ